MNPTVPEAPRALPRPGRRASHGVVGEMMVGRGAVLAFMRSYYEDFGVPPSFRQICAKLGFRSPKAASYHIEKLVLEGSVRRLDGEGRHRGYVPTGYKVVKA